MKKTKVFDREVLLGELAESVKDLWKSAADGKPDFLTVWSAEERKEAGDRISLRMDQLKEVFQSYPRPFWAVWQRRKWKSRVETMLREMLWKEPLLEMEKAMTGERFDAFLLETKAFLRMARDFDPDLKPEDMGQAVRNYMVYAIFLELNGKAQKCKPSIFGYSMLYPYTDNYIDSTERTEEEKEHYNRMIAGKIRGEIPEIISHHEKKTAELLAGIEADYARPDEIFEGLLYMLEAQRESQKQTDGRLNLGEEDILDISVYKGGLSVLIDRYFADHPLTGRDLLFYYGFGFLLQLCDDLQDIAQDGQEGSRTVFSVCTSKEETVKKVNRLLNFTGRLFELCDTSPEQFRRFLFQNCCLLILFSAVGSREYMTEEWLSWAEARLPVSVDFMGKIKTGFSEKEAGADKKYGKMMDLLICP